MVQQTFSGVPGDRSPGDVLPAADMDKLREFILALVEDGTEATTGQTSSLLMDALTGVWRLAELEDGDGNTIYDRDSGVGMGLRQVVTFTADGSFTKATYPWLRAVRVLAVGGGGGGGGADLTPAGDVAAGGGGGGGAYAESLVLVAALAASETVTVGAGGNNGVANIAGTDGGDTSFGAHVIAKGGGVGASADPVAFPTLGALPGAGGPQGTSTGTVRLSGSPGQQAELISASGPNLGSAGGQAGGGYGPGSTAVRTSTTATGTAGGLYGSGGGGGLNCQNQSNNAGGDGADGIVIVELYG